MSVVVDKPAWLWLDSETAVKLSDVAQFNTMRESHGMLSPELFAQALAKGEIEILIFKNESMALVSWGYCAEGKTLHVLTIYGTMETADETIECLELAARHAGAECIMAVTRHGWRDVARHHDYDTHPCLFIKKVLT